MSTTVFSRRAAETVGKGTLPKESALPGAGFWDAAEYAADCHMWPNAT